MGKAMTDFFAEPVRSELIPGFKSVYNAAMHAVAIGCGISGSGPSIFALSENKDLGSPGNKNIKKIISIIKEIRDKTEKEENDEEQ